MLSGVYKLSGIVVWGTATLPYLVLTILLIRGLMLPGSLTGITYYLQPELYRLLDTQVTFKYIAWIV
jgi:solute carrier family 6 noradrenalin transporter-like protein 2